MSTVINGTLPPASMVRGPPTGELVRCRGVSAMEPKAEKELVVVDDGSIPAEQLARLGLRPGARPLVVETIDREDDAVDLEVVPCLTSRTSPGKTSREGANRRAAISQAPEGPAHFAAIPWSSRRAHWSGRSAPIPYLPVWRDAGPRDGAPGSAFSFPRCSGTRPSWRTPNQSSTPSTSSSRAMRCCARREPCWRSSIVNWPTTPPRPQLWTSLGKVLCTRARRLGMSVESLRTTSG